MFTQHDVEKRVAAINALLSDKDAHWEKRVVAVSTFNLSLYSCLYTLKLDLQLRELRSVAKNEVIDHTHFIAVLRDVENSMELSVSCVCMNRSILNMTTSPWMLINVSPPCLSLSLPTHPLLPLVKRPSLSDNSRSLHHCQLSCYCPWQWFLSLC